MKFLRLENFKLEKCREKYRKQRLYIKFQWNVNASKAWEKLEMGGEFQKNYHRDYISYNQYTMQ